MIYNSANLNEIHEKVCKEFYKRFAYGEQYLSLNHIGEIEEMPRDYYWQEREVYNIILPYINLLKNKGVKDKDLYGRHGFVALVYNLQVAYNKVKNNALTIINRHAFPIALIEDGSVDIDSLEEEGLAPGKILVYRQGAQKPDSNQDFLKTDILFSLSTYEEHLETEVRKMYELFLEGWYKNNEKV